MPSSSKISFLEKNKKKEEVNAQDNLKLPPIDDSKYQSLPDANNSTKNSNVRNETRYKGFSTSITHIFQNPENARVDCCSLVCCGLLQSDYNRYILHNRRPPTFTNRFIMYILIPIGFFSMAGYAAVEVHNRLLKEVLVYMWLSVLVGWVLGGCFRTTYKHSLVRRDLLRKVRAIRSGTVIDSHEELAAIDSRDSAHDSQDELEPDEIASELVCAHRLCGCYKTDLSDEELYGGERLFGQDNQQEDFFGCVNRFFSYFCCGRLFRHHWQIFGVCGVAQEGREIDSLVPIDRRRMDYVTFQSYFDYMNDFRKIRAEKNGKLWDHFMALSKLSRMLMKTFVYVTSLLLIFSVVVAPKGFQWANMLVFVATFFQAFIILYFVHWHWNRFDLSLDAVIKYFASGFILTTSLALFFESIISAVLMIASNILTQTFTIEDVDQNDDNGYGRYFQLFHSSFAGLYSYASMDSMKETLQQFPIVGIMYQFCTAYLVAALSEESCKYFGFKMVEHPDFVSDKDLEKAVAMGRFDSDDMDDHEFEWGGGLECGDIEDEGDDTVLETSESPARQTLSSRFIDGNSSFDEHDTPEQRKEQKLKAELYACPPKSLSSTGAAITVAMVSVAVGFACCENLIYIFVYGHGPLSSEIAILLYRSLFPVHPLCAAIQSIGVCRQKLENDKSIGLGRILLPGIILHGTYDFSIMLLDFLSTLGENDEENEEIGKMKDIIYSIFELILAVFCVVFGALYYIGQSRAQKVRLEQMDTARSFVGISV